MPTDETIISTYMEVKSVAKTARLLSVSPGYVRCVLRKNNVQNVGNPKPAPRKVIKHWYAVQHGEDHSIDNGATYKSEAIKMAKSFANDPNYNGEEIRILVYSESRDILEDTIIHRESGGFACDHHKIWVESYLLACLLGRQKKKGVCRISEKEAALCIPYMDCQNDVYTKTWTRKKTGDCYSVKLHKENDIWTMIFKEIQTATED